MSQSSRPLSHVALVHWEGGTSALYFSPTEGEGNAGAVHDIPLRFQYIDGRWEPAEPDMLRDQGFAVVVGPRVDEAKLREDLRRRIEEIRSHEDEEGPAPIEVSEFLREYAEGRRDFRGVRFAKEADLSGLEFHGVDFGEACLAFARFRGAKFQSCAFDGAVAERTLFAEASFDACRFRNSRLRRACFEGAQLQLIDFSGALVDLASLFGAQLRHVTFDDANLWRAGLYECQAHRCTFVGAKLDEAQMIDVSFVECDFSKATAKGSDLSKSVVANCKLGGLTQVSLSHRVWVDWATVVRSIGDENLMEFLRATGMPNPLAAGLVSTITSLDETGRSNLLQSVFISFGGEDQEFAKRLSDALQSRAVATFFYPDHGQWGKPHRRIFAEEIAQHDRMILICSRHSLEKPGVLDELKKALARETREGSDEILFPLKIDDYVFNGWRPDDATLKQAITDRYIAPFDDYLDDEAKFEAAVDRLVESLRKRPGASA